MVANPLSEHGFLTTMIAVAAHNLGLDGDWQARMYMTGDEDLPSCFPITDLAVASIGCAELALADLLQAAGIKPSDVVVDRHLASAWFRYSLAPMALVPAGRVGRNRRRL
jgi:hypothetical protein